MKREIKNAFQTRAQVLGGELVPRSHGVFCWHQDAGKMLLLYDYQRTSALMWS